MMHQKIIYNLIDIKEIYLEPVIKEYARGQEIFTKYPEAQIIEVPSHWKIPELHGNAGSIDDWTKIKRNVLILGTKKSLTARPHTRSSNFVAPSQSNGCTMACSYCYAPRRKGFANPVSVRYKRGLKAGLVDTLIDMVQEQMPYCQIRYAF